MMSENAFRDLNLLPKCERANDSSSKDILAKPYVDPTNENIEGKQRKCIVSLVEAPMNGNEVVNCGTEVVVAEVEYIESEKLDDLEDVDKGLKMLLAGLESKDWVLLCETLNNVRRFSIYHKEALQDILDNVISFVVKSLKNPRSAVCKTAIMTSADIFKAFGDHVIEMLDPMVLDYECNKMTILDCECNKESQWNKPADSTSSVTKNLVQLLLKSSQDKRFVCEAAEKALIALTIWVSPILLLPKLQPYLKNRNPRIRAKASMCFSRSVPRLGAEGIKEYGIDKLIQIASSQLSDQLPESREAARTLLSELQTAYEKSPVLAPEPDTPSEQLKAHSWQQFCESSLSKLSAQAVLRATSITREGLVSGL